MSFINERAIDVIAGVTIVAGGNRYDLDSKDLSCGNAAALRGFDGNPAASLGSFAYQPAARSVDLEITAFGTGVRTMHGMLADLENDAGTSTVEVTANIGSLRKWGDGSHGGTVNDYTTFTQHIGLSKADLTAVTRKYNTYKLAIVLLDGCWTTWMRNRYTFRPSTNAGAGAINYPIDYPHDLGANGNPSEIDFVNASRKLWPLITITGPCANPSVNIAGNRYAITQPLTDGQTLEIDTLHKTVTLEHGGVSENIIAKAVLGMGEGSGSYIFQPLPHYRDKRRAYAIAPPTDALTTVTLLETVPAINI